MKNVENINFVAPLKHKTFIIKTMHEKWSSIKDFVHFLCSEINGSELKILLIKEDVGVTKRKSDQKIRIYSSLISKF